VASCCCPRHRVTEDSERDCFDQCALWDNFFEDWSRYVSLSTIAVTQKDVTAFVEPNQTFKLINNKGSTYSKNSNLSSVRSGILWKIWSISCTSIFLSSLASRRSKIAWFLNSLFSFYTDYDLSILNLQVVAWTNRKTQSCWYGSSHAVFQLECITVWQRYHIWLQKPSQNPLLGTARWCNSLRCWALPTRLREVLHCV